MTGGDSDNRVLYRRGGIMKDTSCGYPENRYNHIVQIWTARERINGAKKGETR